MEGGQVSPATPADPRVSLRHTAAGHTHACEAGQATGRAVVGARNRAGRGAAQRGGPAL